jgi:hypothetical protein
VQPNATRRDDPLIWQVHVKFLQGRSGLITFLGENARYANSNSVLPACISTQYLTMITSHIQAGHEPIIELVSVRPVGLSWSRLRNASLKNLAAHECLELLKKAPRLTCFCVINIRATGLPDPSIHVVHRAMKTLRLYTQKGTPRVPMLESFMNALTLPSLQEFDCDTLGALSREHLRELVRRSSRPLVRLRTGSRNMVASAEDAELLHQLNQFSSAD